MLSGAIAWLGVRRGSLAPSGAIGAVVTGTLTTAYGGYTRATLLVGFFMSSSALSRLPKTGHNGAEVVARVERRDAVQVAANGALATLLAVTGSADDDLHPYLGALAAVTADTWATEIGSRWGGTPHHLLTRQPVPPGTSGGVTFAGTVGSLAGGMFLGCLAAVAQRLTGEGRGTPAQYIIGGAVAGVSGSFVDSLLGASMQERRWCPRCAEPTERAVHNCGERTIVIGGIPGVDNDVVNVACSLAGVLLGYVVQRLGAGAPVDRASMRPFH